MTDWNLGQLPKRELTMIAQAILGTAPTDREATTTLEDAHAAGVAARADSADRVTSPYRRWDLQRAFIAGWNDANREAA